MHTTDGAWPTSLCREAVRRAAIVDALATSVWIALVIGGFLLARRLGGGSAAHLPFSQLAATAIVLTIWSVCVGTALRRRTSAIVSAIVRNGIERCGANIQTTGIEVVRNTVASWLPTVVLVLFAIACSFPGNRFVDWLIWLPAIAMSVVIPGLVFYDDHGARSLESGAEMPADLGPFRDGNENGATELNLPDVRESERLLQQIARFRSLEGTEVIQATLFAEFQPGERNSTLYIAFCPPLETLPEVAAEITSGPDADLKIVQVLHNGAQLEVRLNAASEVAERVAIELIAPTAPSAPTSLI